MRVAAQVETERGTHGAITQHEKGKRGSFIRNNDYHLPHDGAEEEEEEEKATFSRLRNEVCTSCCCIHVVFLSLFFFSVPPG